jgi:hypothetical protein
MLIKPRSRMYQDAHGLEQVTVGQLREHEAICVNESSRRELRLSCR